MGWCVQVKQCNCPDFLESYSCLAVSCYTHIMVSVPCSLEKHSVFFQGCLMIYFKQTTIKKKIARSEQCKDSSPCLP